MPDEEITTAHTQRGKPIRSLDDPRMQELGEILRALAAGSNAKVIGTRDEIAQEYERRGLSIDRETLQNRLMAFRQFSADIRLYGTRGPYVLKEPEEEEST